MRNNSIRLNGEGVRLWTRGGAVLPYWPGHEVCYNFTLSENTFEANHTGFVGYTPDEVENAMCHGFVLEKNIFHDNRVGIRFKRVRDCHVRGNHFTQNVQAAIQIEADADVEIDANNFDGNRVDVAR